MHSIHVQQRILLTSRKTSPVCKDHQWQLLFVEIIDGLSRFKSGVWVPYLTCLRDYLQQTQSKLTSVNVPTTRPF